jgi:ribosomal protein S21
MKRGLTVIIHDGNVEKGLRKFKKKVADSRLLQDLREREQYTKPTTKKKMARNAAKSRWKRHLASQQLPKKLF